MSGRTEGAKAAARAAEAEAAARALRAKAKARAAEERAARAAEDAREAWYEWARADARVKALAQAQARREAHL